MSEKIPFNIRSTISPEETARLREKHYEILDMVRVMIDEGKVASLCFISVGPEPSEEEGKVPIGTRFLVRAQHLDTVDNLFKGMMKNLEEAYGMTVADIRRLRQQHEAKNKKLKLIKP